MKSTVMSVSPVVKKLSRTIMIKINKSLQLEFSGLFLKSATTISLNPDENQAVVLTSRSGSLSGTMNTVTRTAHVWNIEDIDKVTETLVVSWETPARREPTS